MGWADLPSDQVISIGSRLADPGDFARFRGVCRSWESASRGFRPTFSPWLAVINGNPRPKKKKTVSFISHASNDRIYRLRVPLPRGGRRMQGVDLDCSRFRTNKDGWMVFVLDDGVPIIVNPLTGARNRRPLPSVLTLRDPPWKGGSYCNLFLSDSRVLFAECHVDEDRHVLAAATPGDAEWSVLRLSLPCYRKSFIRSIVFHKADRKFYAMNCQGEMQSFRLSGGRRSTTKKVFGEVSSILAPKAITRKQQEEEEEVHLFKSYLMSDGTNLLRVRKIMKSREFEIFKYRPGDDADMWVKTSDYLGDKALFFDSYGARLLPLPFSDHHQGDGDGDGWWPRRNCFYFTEESHEYVHHVRIYDAGKGTVEPCFCTSIQSSYNHLPALMWFTPSLSLKSQQLAS